MKPLFYKIITLIIIILSLTLSPLESVFVNREKVAEAQTSTSIGGAIGGAVAAGVVCFLETKLEAWGFGLATRATAIPEGYLQLAKYSVAVPTVVLNNPAVAMSTETSNALTQSKDCIRDVIAKILLDWIVDQTIEWIQGGGSPRFVTDWDTFLSDAFNVGVGEVIQNSNFRFLCSPFGAQLQATLLPVQRFPLRVGCTLDQITGNIENFYDNFSNGGWLAYSAMWQPQNNYYGSLLMFHDEALSRGLAKQKAAEDEALAGKGFLSVKKRICVEYSTEPVPTSEGPAVVQCIKYKDIVQTPGAAVGDVVAKSITSDIDWAANIKSWVAALTNAVINRLTREGLSMMRNSIATEIEGGDSDPWEGTDRGTATRENIKDYIVSEYQDLIGKIGGLITLEDNVSSTLREIRGILERLSDNSCGIPSDVINTTEVDRRLGEVESDIDYFRGLITEVNGYIQQANSIPNPTYEQLDNLYQAYNDFFDEESIREIILGTRRNVINERLLDNRDYHLRKAREALSACNISSPGGGGGSSSGGGGGGGN